MPSAEELRAELDMATAQGRGTDAGRIKKQLAALDVGDDEPKAKEVRSEAAGARAEAAGTDEGGKTRAPQGRTSKRGRASET